MSMKKVFVMMAVLLASVTASANDNFKLTGKIDGASNDTLCIEYTVLQPQKQHMVHKVAVKDGEFSFGAKLHEARRAKAGLLFGKAYDWVGRVLDELGRVGVLPLGQISRGLDGHQLHSKVDSQIRNFVFARVADGGQKAQKAAVSHVAGNHDSVNSAKGGLCVAASLKAFRVDFLYLKLGVAGSDRRVEKGFLYALDAVVKVVALSYKADCHFLFRRAELCEELGPRLYVAL